MIDREDGCWGIEACMDSGQLDEIRVDGCLRLCYMTERVRTEGNVGFSATQKSLAVIERRRNDDDDDDGDNGDDDDGDNDDNDDDDDDGDDDDALVVCDLDVLVVVVECHAAILDGCIQLVQFGQGSRSVEVQLGAERLVAYMQT